MVVRKIFSMLAMAAGLAAAGPVLKIDNTVFDAGPVAENSTIRAAFKLTNTGTATLKITSVRPGCGCTVVKYDSIIAPGKSIVLEPVVDLKGMRAGRMSRGVNVTTNTANAPTLNLTIAATIMSAVNTSENYLEFGGEEQKTLFLTSAKTDLNVTGVVFRPREGGSSPGWAANIPLNIEYKFGVADTVRTDGYKVYKLDIASPAGGKPLPGQEGISGEFRITTNHPDKKEIIIGGMAR